MDYQPSYGFLKDCLYRSESYKVTLADAYKLNTFQGKLDQKAAWARGVFISYGGFTQEGLHAFGRGRKVICMSGEDIYKALGRRIPIAEVIDRKVRAAAETGAAFVPLDELSKQ